MSDVPLDRRALDLTLASLHDFHIDRDRIRIKETLGTLSGGYGDVQFAVLANDGKSQSGSFPLVAVKQLRPVGTNNQRARLAFRLARELKVWAGLRHPNILALIGFYLDKNMTSAWLISPFEANGNISEYLRSHPGLNQRIILAIDTARGLAYLHSLDPPVCHGDIKGANILITSDLHAVLCDFGLAKIIEDSPSGLTTASSFAGSIRYLCPELLLDDEPCRTLKTDIWAWGCLLLEILTGRVPFWNVKGEVAVIHKITQHELPINLKNQPSGTEDTHIEEADRVLLAKCWQIDALLRPTAEYCLKSLLSRFNLPALIRDPHKAPLALRSEGPGWYAISNPQAEEKLDVGEKWSIRHPGAVVSCLRFSVDGRSLAVACGLIVQVYAVESGHNMHFLNEHLVKAKQWGVRHAAVSSTHEAVSKGPIMHTYDVIESSEHDSSPIKFLVFSPDGTQLATGTEQGHIRIWALDQPTCIHIQLPLNHITRALEFSADSQHVLASDGTCLWELGIFSYRHRMLAPPENSVAIVAAAISPTRLIVGAAYTEGIVKLWGPEGGPPQLLKGHTTPVFRMTFSKNEKVLVTSGSDKSLRRWDVEQTGSDDVSSVSIACDGMPQSISSLATTSGAEWILSGSFDSSIRFTNGLDPGNIQCVLFGHDQAVISLATRPSSSRNKGIFASGDLDGVVRVWNYSIKSSFA